MEHFKEVPDVNRLIISPLYLREGLEFAKNQGYNDILISTDDIGISGVSCKHTLNVSLICEYDFIETLIISGYDFTIEPCNLNQLSVLPHLKKLGLWIDKVFTIDFSLFPKLEELKYYHTKQTENVDTLINLKRLHIYNLKSEDLKELKSMNLLEELTLWDAKNINLNGLCQLTNIRTLEIVRSRKMIDIRGLCNSNRLKELSLYYCNNITDISVLNRLSRVKILRLNYCTGLQEAYIGDGVTEIAAKAFAECTALKTVVIGKSIQRIGDQAFNTRSSWDQMTLEKITVLFDDIASGSFPVLESGSRGVFPKPGGWDLVSYKIYVPKGTKAEYQKNWSDYSSLIVEMQ